MDVPRSSCLKLCGKSPEAFRFVPDFGGRFCPIFRQEKDEFYDNRWNIVQCVCYLNYNLTVYLLTPLKIFRTLREPEYKQVVETDFLAASQTDVDEVNMYIQKVLVPKILLGLCPVQILPFQ